MFNPNADPNNIAARAAELSIEQLDRLAAYIEHHGAVNAPVFYRENFEIGISNHIARLMGAYAILKGYVSADRVKILAN